MTNETLNNPSPPVSPTSRSERKAGSKLSLFIILMGLMIVLAAFGYGYFQLARVNGALVQTVTSAKMEVANLHQQMAVMQQTVDQLQQETKTALETINKQSATVANDTATTELYSRLSTLNQQLDQLSLAVTAPKPADDVATEGAVKTEPTTAWGKVWQRMAQGLNEVVTIKYVGNNVPAANASELKTTLNRDLHAQIDAAMWAVMHKNAQVYQASLARVAAMVKEHFATDANETTVVLQELQSLQQINIAG